ncbi:hypothetical protein BN2497_3835 [Janthinobacterium sp. CG23_2]|nr:hypothetical protein BN2497_3835 [Janthinobacterium sp. CG23_2]CUU28315.1 hypothetical protein BN3177_3835 [Janthinobacterium sp. CG23_2]
MEFGLQPSVCSLRSPAILSATFPSRCEKALRRADQLTAVPRAPRPRTTYSRSSRPSRRRRIRSKTYKYLMASSYTSPYQQFFLRTNMSQPANSRASTGGATKATKAAEAKKAAAAAVLKEQYRKRVVLTKLAHTRTQHTKVAISAALRDVGLSGAPANVERVLSLRADADSVRRHRYLNRANGRISAPINALPAPSGRATIRLPLGQPVARLTVLRKMTIETYAKEMFRCGAPGGSSFTVKFASSTSEVGYRVDLDTDWTVYRGSFKGWAANVDCHKICVPADWRTRVERVGLADLGGMMTLDALPMDAPDSIALYAAVWACQGRGYSIKTERGFIAVGGDESFHAETAEKAVAGLLRKRSIGKKSIASIADMSVSVETFIAKYSPIAVDDPLTTRVNLAASDMIFVHGVSRSELTSTAGKYR